MKKILNGPLIKPNAKPNNAIVFLHGYGANGNDLISIADLWKTSFKETIFFSPNAPFKCAWGDESFQWFDLTSISPDKIGEGLNTAGPFLNNFIDDILKVYSLSPEKIFFVGFSQGTMMALYHLCKRINKCAGVMGYSGLLFQDKNFDSDVKSKFPIKLYHGKNDEVIDYSQTISSAEKFKSLEFNVEYKIQDNLGHGIDNEGLQYGFNFIKKTLNI
jgi:phospholipase/carboxylesterase